MSGAGHALWGSPGGGGGGGAQEQTVEDLCCSTATARAHDTGRHHNYILLLCTVLCLAVLCCAVLLSPLRRHAAAVPVLPCGGGSVARRAITIAAPHPHRRLMPIGIHQQPTPALLPFALFFVQVTCRSAFCRTLWTWLALLVTGRVITTAAHPHLSLSTSCLVSTSSQRRFTTQYLAPW